MIWDVGITIEVRDTGSTNILCMPTFSQQGHTNDELPEVSLAVVHMSKMDLDGKGVDIDIDVELARAAAAAKVPEPAPVTPKPEVSASSATSSTLATPRPSVGASEDQAEGFIDSDDEGGDSVDMAYAIKTAAVQIGTLPSAEDDDDLLFFDVDEEFYDAE